MIRSGEPFRIAESISNGGGVEFAESSDRIAFMRSKSVSAGSAPSGKKKA